MWFLPECLNRAWKNKIGNPLRQQITTVVTTTDNWMDNVNFLDVYWFGGSNWVAEGSMATYPPQYLERSINGTPPKVDNMQLGSVATSSVHSSDAQVDPESSPSGPGTGVTTPEDYRVILQMDNIAGEKSYKELLICPHKVIKRKYQRWNALRKQKRRHSNDDDVTEALSTTDTFLLVVGKMIGVAVVAMIPAFEKLGVGAGIITVIVTMAVSGLGARAMWHFCMRHPILRNVADVTAQLFAHIWIPRAGFYLGWVQYFVYNLSVMAVHIKLTVYPITSLLGVQTVGQKLVSRTGAVSGLLVMIFISVFFFVLWTKGPATLSPEVILDSENTRERMHMWINTESSPSEQMAGILRIQFASIIASSIPMLMGEMKKPKDFPKVLAAHKVILTCVLILFGSIPCLYVTPQHVGLHMWDMLPTGWSELTACLVFLPGLLQGQIYGIVNAQPMLQRLGNGEAAGFTLLNILIMGFIWSLAWLLSQLFFDFGFLLSIIGGVFGCAFGCFLPALTQIAMLNCDIEKFGLRSALKRTRSFRKLLIAIILLTSAASLAYMTSGPVQEFETAIENKRYVWFLPKPDDAGDKTEDLVSSTLTGGQTASSTVFLAEETGADYYVR